LSEGVQKLEKAMQVLEEQIAVETELLKSSYLKVASLLPEDKSYYLIGIQTGSVVKPYLFTKQGVGAQGEGLVSITDFIDSAMRFANYPKRKIEVLSSFAQHLEKIAAMIGFQETS
jgi:hypothetical protein